MSKFIVTIKKPKHADHDPKNKVTGICGFSRNCTDVTGQHHSFLVEANSEQDIRDTLTDVHITRIESVDSTLKIGSPKEDTYTDDSTARLRALSYDHA